MRAVDLILKKRNGQSLSQDEINFFVKGYTQGIIPDYQVAALLMAICFTGMQGVEIAQLTRAMAHSGAMLDLSDIPGIKVDKHSTGGVGDKVTLVALPIAAACGLPVAKMSGRALGHTGGTLDKLESIPGFQIELSIHQFTRQVQEIGISLMGQSQNIAPADKKLYALRDATGTVDNIGLIAASIMSKKLASGADAFVLDIKVGSGAFAKDLVYAQQLAETMVTIAENNGKQAKAILTNMDQPLGYAVGNWLEILEAANTLQGQGPLDLTTISKEIAAHMLHLGQKGSLAHCHQLVDQSLVDGSALATFYQLISAQGGDTNLIQNPQLYPPCHYVVDYLARKSGYITAMDTGAIGLAAGIMGASRDSMTDTIDYNAGLVFHQKLNAWVEPGDPIATLYSKNQSLAKQATDILDHAIQFSSEKPPDITLIYP